MIIIIISRQQAAALKKNAGHEAPPEEQNRYLTCREKPMVHNRTDSTLSFQPNLNITIPLNIVLLTLQWFNIRYQANHCIPLPSGDEGVCRAIWYS
jgi:hypothetical protein